MENLPPTESSSRLENVDNTKEKREAGDAKQLTLQGFEQHEEIFSGPLPPPHYLAQYDKVISQAVLSVFSQWLKHSNNIANI